MIYVCQGEKCVKEIMTVRHLNLTPVVFGAGDDRVFQKFRRGYDQERSDQVG